MQPLLPFLTSPQLLDKDETVFAMLEGQSAELYAEELHANANYVLQETARQGRWWPEFAKDEAHEAIDERSVERDTGHDGLTLEDFARLEPAVQARLTPAEVGALRIYTSSTFRVINGALRARCTPHPLAYTTLTISTALKKLRANNMGGAKTNFRTQYLWRGMRNRVATDDFLFKGGAEM